MDLAGKRAELEKLIQAGKTRLAALHQEAQRLGSQIVRWQAQIELLDEQLAEPNPDADH